MIVLDTNVVSELLRPVAGPGRGDLGRGPTRRLACISRRSARRNFVTALRFCRPAGAGMRSPRRLRRSCGKTLTNVSCPSTAERRAPLRRLQRLGALPDGRPLRQISRSRPSRARAAWRWRRATSATLTTWGLNCSIHGRVHERNDGRVLPRQDLRATQGWRPEPDGRYERSIRSLVPMARRCSQDGYAPCNRSGRAVAGDSRHNLRNRL